MTEQQRQGISKPLGRVVSGVYILTASHNGQSAAMMASWVMQAGFEPPALAIAIAKSRPIVQLIHESRRLALSIVPAEDKTLMKFYARYKGETDPFLGIATQTAPSGIPILSDALGFLDCTLKQTIDISTDHDLYIAQVIDGASFREGTAFAHQRGNGFHY